MHLFYLLFNLKTENRRAQAVPKFLIVPKLDLLYTQNIKCLTNEEPVGL
jgi:hypothetical protein